MNTHSADETRGLWLGLLGVVIFAMTLPMTRLAVGPASDPQLPPAFVTAGRAAFAGMLSVLYLWITNAPRVQRRHLPALAVSALTTRLLAPGRRAIACDRLHGLESTASTNTEPVH